VPAIPRVASRVSHRYGKGKKKIFCDATSQIKPFTFSTQFTCFTSVRVQILAPEIEKGASRDAALQRLAVYYLLLSCSTSTRVQILTPDIKKICDATSQTKSFTFSTQFTYFTCVRVQILTPEIEKGASRDAALQRLAVYYLLLSCSTSTRVQILTPDMEKGTSRDAALQRLPVYYFRSARQDDAATHSLGIRS
jgi:NADH:ubiquinone oxidoreductase subunit C